MLGRRYQVEIEIEYAGRSLSRDTAGTLERSVRAALDNQASDLSFLVSSDVYNRVIVGATLTATTPLAAMARLDGALDDALMASGLLEEFDVTGKVLHVAPLDHASRESGRISAG
jgi:hypothetical protein